MNPKRRDTLLHLDDCHELTVGIFLAVVVLGLGVGLGNLREQTRELAQATESMEQHRDLLRALDSVRQENKRVLMQNRATLEGLTLGH